SVEHALMMIFYILLDIRDKKISSCSALQQYVYSDILQKLQQTLHDISSDPLESFEERNELFLDLTENYRKEGLYTHDLKAAVSLAENHTVSYDSAHVLAQLAAFHADMESFEHLFRNYLISELFSELLLPDSDEKDMIIMAEWIAMEYAAILHLLFLQAQMHKKMSDFSLIRDTIVIVSRMMGYEQEDIMEYMESCFQSPLWDWGYLALLVI
ncbi:MAG TPA: hypothetical protein PLU43_11335, partial [Lachnospiraceae bacterium]|nr:hypothetical protein [Lachnospiraceae bacterium]